MFLSFGLRNFVLVFNPSSTNYSFLIWGGGWETSGSGGLLLVKDGVNFFNALCVCVCIITGKKHFLMGLGKNTVGIVR